MYSDTSSNILSKNKCERQKSSCPKSDSHFACNSVHAKQTFHNICSLFACFVMSMWHARDVHTTCKTFRQASSNIGIKVCKEPHPLRYSCTPWISTQIYTSIFAWSIEWLKLSIFLKSFLYKHYVILRRLVVECNVQFL